MLEKITKALKDKQITLTDDGYMLTLLTCQQDASAILTYLKQEKFNLLSDLSAVDYPDRQQRFELIYNLLNIYDNKRIIVKFSVEDQAQVESIADLFSAAIWYEREVWDMFGIYFVNNPDLRRILTDYGFEGHPLRKDFPLTGFKEVRYDESQQKVIYEPVKLMQDFRNFDFLSPWEGPDYVLPGDEKAGKKA
jgi:NADH-quinone oxidoreductase subunit C